MISERQNDQGWGSKVIPRLAVDLKNELPEEKGFSERNIGRMIAFFRAYPILPPSVAKFPSVPPAVQQTPEIGELPNLPPSVANSDVSSFDTLWATLLQISWSHNVILIQKVKEQSTRLWYASQIIEHGWSRDTLASQIKSEVHTRHGKAITNFDGTLPEAHAGIATDLLKDPFVFDFLTLEEPFHERELETGLLTHIEKFLLELGRGFAFVGRQYEMTVGDSDFYIDLLFYHLKLRCFVVVDLKKGQFKPEHAGKMNFYCSSVDSELRHESDAQTIGLILCQTKNSIVAEYALRGIEKPIGVADYELTTALPETMVSSLPSIEDIEAELSTDLPGADVE